MLIVMHANATAEEIEHVCSTVRSLGLRPEPIAGGGRTAIGVLENNGTVDPAPFVALAGVRQTIAVSRPYKQVSREWQPEPTVIQLPFGARVGGENIVVMGGPCAVESEDQIMAAAEGVAQAGGQILRGGAYKPRTSPYSFQGMGEEGLELLARAGETYGLAVVTEAIDVDSANAVAKHADLIQIGARNMQNFHLLKHVGTLGKPVLLKRGPSATINEWLLAAEYIVTSGNAQVILCERGLRSFDGHTRNLLDLSAVAVAKSLTHLPVIADPSHGTGHRPLVPPAARAAIAIGADGVIVETHPNPDQARSDGPQSLTLTQFASMVIELNAVAAALGRGPSLHTSQVKLRKLVR